LFLVAAYKQKENPMPTLAQIAPLVRIFLPVIVTLLTQYVGADAAQSIGSLIATLVGVTGWSLYRNTQSGLTQTVAAIKDDNGQPAVKVLVSPTAPQGLLQLASDTSVPAVVHAATVAATAPPPKAPYETSRRTS
jgi:hypothetical protein